jgi:DNA-binding YbaB/EbfC family protein
MAGVGKLLKQAQRIQKKMETLNQELSQKEIEVSSGGGAVVVRVSLAQELKSIKLDPEFLKEETSVVEAAITEALREALAESKEQSQAAMGEITAGFQLPGMM